MRRKNRVYHRGFSETSLTCKWRSIEQSYSSFTPQKTREKRMIRTDDDDIKLETTLQELVLNLLGDGIETNIRSRTDFFNVDGGHYDECFEEKRRWTWTDEKDC